MRRAFSTALAVLITLCAGLCAPGAAAGLKEAIGFTRLQAELGPAMPTGSDILVTQVEARTSYGDPLGPYMPDPGNSQFTGKMIHKKSADAVTTYSGHATSVGQRYYGNASSLTPAVGTIEVYETNHFLTSGMLHHGYSHQPGYTFSDGDKASASRVANHSWVGSASAATAADILRRLDYLAAADGFIQVVAPDNATSNRPLLISAFNTLSVGRADGTHQRGSAGVDAVYTAGRVKPDLVVPESRTSYAAPPAASAVALLLETGREPALSTDPVQPFTTDRDGAVIRNAQRPEVIKAALMAGARRVALEGAAIIADYRVSPTHQGANGLDTRFGAGQLDIYHGYHILAAGEQNSAEDYPAGQGQIDPCGFDFDPFFGGVGDANAQGTYHFTAGQDERMLQAALVWHLVIHGGTWTHFNGSAVLNDMALVLDDVTDPGQPMRIAAAAGEGDNSAHLWVPLSPGRAYRLQVTPGPQQAPFNGAYALAWRRTTPADSDGDGMPDDWEVYYGLDPLEPSDGALDPDGDGLSNALEFFHGTDPGNPDTDGDGFSDGAETAAGSDPLDPRCAPPAVGVSAMGPVGLLLTFGALCVLTRLLPKPGHRAKRSPNRPR